MSKRLRIVLVVAVAVSAVVAAGCGGSDDSAGSDVSPTAEWAEGLCSSITTWTSSLRSVVDGLKGDLSKDSLTAAVDDAKASTDTFTTSLRALGRPDTEAGQDAKDAVDELSTELQDGMAKIEEAVGGASGFAGIAAAVPVISSTLTTAAQQISDTLSSLQDIDAKGDLERAFKDVESCQGLG